MKMENTKTVKLTCRLLRLSTIVLAIVLATNVDVQGGEVITITDVDITPSVPTESDPIIISTYAMIDIISVPNVTFWDTDFYQSGDSLQLDLKFDEFGMMGVPIEDTLWSWPEDIGMLTAGMYHLAVQAWIYKGTTLPPPVLDDEYFTDFQVTPEPATLLLLGLGVVMVRRKRLLKR